MELLNEVIIPIIKPILALLGTIFGLFLFTMWGELKRENKKLNNEVEDNYEAKKRQDKYDAIPVDTKREWLRSHNNKTLSDMVKACSKSRRAL